MAAVSNKTNTVIKKTKQGGSSPKTSSMNKSHRKSFKRYRGQGK